MSCDSVAIVSTPPSSSAPDTTDVINDSVAVSESPTPPPPQAIPLITTTTTSNSSRCTSPMSPPSVSDQNVSAATSSNEDESMSAVMNLTMNKSNSDNNNNNLKNTNSSNGSPTSIMMMKHNNHHSGSKRPSNHISNHQTTIMLNNFNMIEQLRQQQQLHLQQQLNSHHNNKMNKIMSNEYSNVATSRNSAGGKSSINNKTIRHRHRNHNNNNTNNNSSNNRNSNQLLDSTSVTNSPDFTQLLLEYRQVLLDVLAKTIVLNDNGADDTATTAAASSSSSSPQQMESNHKGIILPIKCQCGYTSELSKHITRTSTYVHQLELKFHSLVESIKISTDPNRYTPKRPWFINPPAMMTPTTATASAPLSSLAPPPSLYPHAPVTKVSSLLEKKKSSRMSSMIADKQQQPISIFSGNNSINGSLNGDDDDIDSDEDDVNHHDMNLSENHIYTNGSIDETNHHQIPNNNAINNVAGKTILEGYLESMKQNIPSDDDDDDGGRSDEEDGVKLDQSEIVDIIEEDDEELDGGSIGEEDCTRGPGKRIDVKTKKLVVQMQRSGASFTDISRQMGISRKSVRRIISNYRAYGLLEKKRECRIQKGMQDLILRLYSQGRSYTQISRATTISKPTIAKIIKQLTDSNIFAKGPTNGLMMNANGNGAAAGVGQDSLIIDNIDDDMDEEREMIVDDRAVVDMSGDGDVDDEDDEDDEEEEQDADYGEDNTQNDKNDMEPNIINSFTLYPRVHSQHQPQQQSQSHQAHNSVNKSRRNMSLIQGPYNNGGGSMKQSHQYQSSLNGVGLLHNNNNNRLSLIKPQQDRFKPYDLKVKQNSSNETSAQVLHHNRRAHSIVPPLPATATHLYGIHPQPNRPMPQVKMYDNNNNSKLTKKIDSNNNNTNNNNSKHHHNVRELPRDNNNGMIRSDRQKSSLSSNKMSLRQSVDMPSFKESLIVPEIADKNNNTTLNNCNMTLTSTSNSMNGSRSNNNDSNNNNTNNNSSTISNNNGANLPPIPASLIEGNSDSDASLVPRNFIDNFPAGIMNSLNPNRATKLTLDDFNIVWQLRSQHWTHNQIRKYFQQRGKSISKSSISRIMNGKQRNFQQFFSVVPSGSNF